MKDEIFFLQMSLVVEFIFEHLKNIQHLKNFLN